MQYNVITNLKHNRVLYAPESLIELDDEVAAPLIKDGVIEELKERPKPQPAKSNAASNTRENKSADKTSGDSTEGNEGKDDSDESGNDSSGDGEKALEDLSYPELQNRAEALGLKFVGVSRVDLIASIRETEAKSDDDDNGDDADDL